jgi:hypothetical protein
MSDNNFELQTPVLFLVFNRLDTTKQVFEAIRQAKPPRLYVASDGARANREGEREKVQAVRDYIINNIDWNCEVKTLFQDKNLGCRVAVSTAIDWFFDNEEQGIILEDDCLPEQSFFRFCEELLNKYKDDKRVMSIGGYCYRDESIKLLNSYFFTRYHHWWGWASWSRAWQYYDRSMEQWDAVKNTKWLLTIGDGNLLFKTFWGDKFNSTYLGKIDTWDYQWLFSCWCQNGVAILPSKNLIKNLGFAHIDATHTQNKNDKLALIPVQSLTFPLSHPLNIIRNHQIDKWLDRNRYHHTITNLIKRKFKNKIINIIKILKKI